MVLPEQLPEWRSLVEKKIFLRDVSVSCQGAEAAPQRRGPWKGCRSRNWCHWGCPCLLSPAGACVPSARGTKRSALPPESLGLPVPPCPASRHGHIALLAELPVHLPVCLPGCLSVCLSGHSSRQGELLQPRSGVPRGQDGLPAVLYFVVCLFASLLTFVAAAEMKK